MITSPLVPTHLAGTEPGLVGEIAQRLFGEGLRVRVAVGRVVLPWEEDHSPVVRLLLLLGRFETLLDDVPEMPSAPAAPRRLHNDGPVFRTRKGTSQNLLGTP